MLTFKSKMPWKLIIYQDSQQGKHMCNIFSQTLIKPFHKPINQCTGLKSQIWGLEPISQTQIADEVSRKRLSESDLND